MSERRGWRWWRGWMWRSLLTRTSARNGQLLRLKEEKMELEKKLAVMKQPAALPGHLGLQAAHLGRDGPGLLLQPLISDQ